MAKYEKNNKKRFYAAIAAELKRDKPLNEIDVVSYRHTTAGRSDYVTERVTKHEIDIVNRTLEKRCNHGYIKCPYFFCE